MNAYIPPTPWNPERIEAALAIAIEHSAPRWAEKLLLVMLTARDAAPEGQDEAWAEAARDAFLQEVGTIGDKMAADVHATPEQTTRFAEAAIAALLARFAELKAATYQRGGSA